MKNTDDKIYNKIHTKQARAILNPKANAELMDFAAGVIAEFCKDPYNQELAKILKERAKALHKCNN